MVPQVPAVVVGRCEGMEGESRTSSNRLVRAALGVALPQRSADCAETGTDLANEVILSDAV
jgi:hypothetical protein